MKLNSRRGRGVPSAEACISRKDYLKATEWKYDYSLKLDLEKSRSRIFSLDRFVLKLRSNSSSNFTHERHFVLEIKTQIIC